MRFIKPFTSFKKLYEQNDPEVPVPNKPTGGDTEKSSKDYLEALLTTEEVKKYKIIKETPYEIEVEIPNETKNETKVSIAKRGGDLDYKGKPADFKNTTVELDSQEIEKKFQWIKSKIENMDSKEFQEKKDAIITEYAKRFKDSEMSVREVGIKDGKKLIIEYSHRFLQNDNYAQSDYLTSDNKTIKKGEKVPQNTKVLRFYVGEVSYTKPNIDQPTKTFIQLTNKVVTIDVSGKTLKGGATKENAQKMLQLFDFLVKSGFQKGNAEGNYRTISKTPMWIEKVDYIEKIKKINTGLKDTYNIENFLAPSDSNLSKGLQ
jgi:hypothetical protein